MLKQFTNRSFSTVYIFAGSMRHDIEAAQFMKEFSESSNEKVTFKGMGGYIFYNLGQQ